MGAAAEWTEPRRTLRSRPRAALSRSPGAPLPGGPPQHIPRRRPRARRGPRAPPGAAGWPGTVAHKGQNRAYSERFLVHARVHAGLSPTRSPGMISRPTKFIARSTTRMLLLALSGAPWDGAKNCNDRRRNKFQLLIDAAVLLQVRYRFCLSRSLLPYRWWDIFLTKQGSMYIF